MPDVLVIGSGGAGLAAAIAARDAGARVTLATKLGVASCNTAKAQGGIQAALGDDDSPDTHFEDVMRSSHDTADPALVRALVEHGPEAIAWLEGLDVAFNREADGRLRFRAANIALHVLDREFVRRMASEGGLPFHRADKKIPTGTSASSRRRTAVRTSASTCSSTSCSDSVVFRAYETLQYRPLR